MLASLQAVYLRRIICILREIRGVCHAEASGLSHKESQAVHRSLSPLPLVVEASSMLRGPSKVLQHHTRQPW